MAAHSRSAGGGGRKRSADDLAREQGTSRMRDGAVSVPESLRALVGEHLEAQTCKALTAALERRRDVFVFEVASRVSDHLRAVAGLSTPTSRDGDGGSGEWLPVESLSALRALVGGRFQQLKQRWVEAGLPLREHRGDRTGTAEFNERGWAELTNWVLKQGFEARRAGEGAGYLFELRAVGKKL